MFGLRKKEGSGKAVHVSSVQVEVQPGADTSVGGEELGGSVPTPGTSDAERIAVLERRLAESDAENQRLSASVQQLETQLHSSSGTSAPRRAHESPGAGADANTRAMLQSMGVTAAEIDAALAACHGIMQAAAEKILAEREGATEAAGQDTLTDAGRRAHGRRVKNFRDALDRRDFLATIKVTTQQFEALPKGRQERLLDLRRLSKIQLLFRSRLKRAASILAEPLPEWWLTAQRLHAAATDGGELPCDGFGCAWKDFRGNRDMEELVRFSLHCPVEHFTKEQGAGRGYERKKAPASYIEYNNEMLNAEKAPASGDGQCQTDHLVRFLFAHECFGEGMVVEVYCQAGVPACGTGGAYQRVRLLTIREAAKLETVEKLGARLGEMSKDDAFQFYSDAFDGRITW